MNTIWIPILSAALIAACSSDDGSSNPANMAQKADAGADTASASADSNTPRPDTVLCDGGDTKCLIITQRQISCSDVCAERNASCEASSVKHWYRCSAMSTAVGSDDGCDEIPPDELAGCGPYESMDCRCR